MLLNSFIHNVISQNYTLYIFIYLFVCEHTLNIMKLLIQIYIYIYIYIMKLQEIKLIKDIEK